MRQDLQPGVSVIIPCYNQGNTVARAVQSALNAGADEIIIVIEAGSDSETVLSVIQRVKEFGNRDLLREVFVEGTIPSGVCHARNLGIQCARHMFVLPLDADDELLPGAIEELLHYYKSGKAVYGDYLINSPFAIFAGLNPNRQVQSIGSENPYSPQYGTNADPAMIYRKSVCHATVLFSKEDWRRVGGYKPEFNIGCEDWEFMLSLADAGVNLTYVNAPIYRKTINANGRGAKCLERRPLIAALLKEYHPKVQL